jgi:tRNA(Arg) A34 adenosine deaminase TadA
MSSIQDITAIIYDRKGRVLSVGKNSYVKTHTLQAKHAKKVGLPDKQFMHAEIHAISKCKDLQKAHRIVVYRYGKRGQPLLAKPCLICQSAIESVGIEVVEWTENDDDA